MIMSSMMGDAMLRERLPALWRRIEDAHYSYLEVDDSPEKLLQKKKLEGYILEYLTLVPHECKFGLAEAAKIFQRTIDELPDYSAYRASIGWAAIARYAGNLLAQPWRKEYKEIRLYSGFYKHEVESNLVCAESLLHILGYRPSGPGKLALDGPVCPDMAAAISRDAIIAYCECQIMSEIWESVWSNGGRVSWAAVSRERIARASSPSSAAARLAGCGESEIYSNLPATSDQRRIEADHTSYQMPPPCYCADQVEEPVQPIINPYLIPKMPPMMYELPPMQCNPVPIMTPYGVPYYYPVQTPYMIPTPVYAPIKHATNIPVNGYPPIYLDMPAVPTAQLIELDGASVYENGKFGRQDDRGHKRNRHAESKRTSKSGFSDVSLPSLPRSDTQPALSKAKEDGMGTYESWDYVFRNLSSKERHGDSRSGFSQSLDRDSRTLDRLDREERRSKYQPTTLDLEDGLQALNLDRSYDEDAYRTAKVNENLMRLKQEQELKKSKQMKKQTEDKRPKKTLEPVGNPKADGLITPKVAPDKVKLLTKKEIKDRKDVIKQQNSNVESLSSVADVKRVKKVSKLIPSDADKKIKPLENGLHKAQSSKTNTVANQSNHDLKAQLVVSLDEPDYKRTPKQNGERERTPNRTDEGTDTRRDKWECNTCTYLNKNAAVACEMCGKSKKGPEIEPLTSGGRECPACTLVNKREARICDACGTSLDHCPTYI
ncbi:Tamo [Danaus plexippus plexippus]|uniref:Tamo n=1 Tax=Danaus plexippus plexippus TaxID=278856 RepID=A0A212ELE5_DANPL|nr:Tamo [Danaus plexippus plexippus]